MADHKEILSLTGLRFVAALYVFAFHIHMRWPITKIPFIDNILSQGAIGMSVFFMLSGYLLMLHYSKASGGVRDYLINRFARIYPVYFLAGLVTLPWLGISLEGSEFDYWINASRLAFIFLSNLFVIQAWFPPLFSYWNNGGSWSISVEVFCYVLLPTLIPHLNKLSMRSLMWTVGGLYSFSIMTGLAGKLFGGNYGIPVFYAMPIFRLPEFILGACAYLMIKNLKAPKFLWLAQLASITILTSYVGVAGKWLPSYIGHNWIVIPVVAVTVCTLGVGQGPINWILSKAIFVWLGKISYCFYSFQALVVLSLISYHGQLVSVAPVFANSKLLAIVAFIFLTILSAAGYYFVEEPARRAIRGRWSSGRNIVSISATTTTTSP